jgi:hypothetical protein
MDHMQGSGAKQDPLLSRGAAPPAGDARALLAEVEAALARVHSPAATEALLAPIRGALEAPADQRDPEKLAPAFELVEDVLEAAALDAG